MKMSFVFFFALFFCFVAQAQEPDPKLSDEELIQQTIQTAYVDGLQNEGDTVKINAGFHPDFDLLIPGADGSLKKYSLSAWKERIRADLASGKLPQKPEEKVSVKFLDIDVTGNAAVAKFEFYVGDKLTFVDYQFLYKYASDWKIVSKIYYRY
ncbi:MAG: nuclear transport factor 2 family protein [Bacteroidales bacterium]|nr:nuclear transport factor 2 family protein [Bacteroidales bacterium]